MTDAPRHPELAAQARDVQHEANNMLTVIYGTIELMRRDAAGDTATRRLDRLEAAARRLDALVRGHLAGLRDG